MDISYTVIEIRFRNIGFGKGIEKGFCGEGWFRDVFDLYCESLRFLFGLG